jgi:2-keto-3-deoxy-L-rhamnonate aldolase RhmA
VVVVQCEHIAAVEAIESIIAVDGVDAVLVGPYDLSGSMGLLGQIEHPDVLAAIRRVAEACTRAGRALGIYANTADRMKPFIEQGYNLVIVGADVAALGEAARATVTALRG